MNIVLIIFDSLRKDCLSAYGQPPWGPVATPHLDAFAAESVVFNQLYPESLPTLPARRALYTGQRVYPYPDGNYRLKGDFIGAPGWGPIPEEHDTLAELLQDAGYRTALISDVYHMFKPSKNFARGFNQWSFLRGQEMDPGRSGPRLSQEELDLWLPRDLQSPERIAFVQQCIINMRGREKETDYFAPQVFLEAANWLDQNQDASKFFLCVESFDPHEPWLAPAHYRRMYAPDEEESQQVISLYRDITSKESQVLSRTQANYSAVVSLCDRWFGYLMESLRVHGRLDDTLVLVMADHGHSVGDRGYVGKRGYPSMPEVFDTPLMVRLPGGEHGGARYGGLLQHTDVSASILEAADVAPKSELHGAPFLAAAVEDRPSPRQHATVGWGSTPTVITDRWWWNGKADGTGMFLYDRAAADPFAENVAEAHPKEAMELFEISKADAGGAFPEWLVDLAREEADAPGCSDLAARQ